MLTNCTYHFMIMFSSKKNACHKGTTVLGKDKRLYIIMVFPEMIGGLFSETIPKTKFKLLISAIDTIFVQKGKGTLVLTCQCHASSSYIGH